MDELGEQIRVIDEALHRHPYILTRLSFAISRKNELHIAAANRDEVSVTRIINERPELAEELDSQKSSPLHIAAARGDENITDSLLRIAPLMCWSRDNHGMNPVHVAAAKGHANVLGVLVRMKPFAALEKLDRGETALHLCVKHGHLEALRALVMNLKELNGVEDDDGETLLHWAVRYYYDDHEDDDGETLLHWAVRYYHDDHEDDDRETQNIAEPQSLQIVKYLMSDECINKINEKSRNSKGQTALDLLKQSRRYKHKTKTANKIKKQLKSRSTFLSFLQKFADPPKNDLRSRRDSIMVVAILIATMAFEAIISPPGGVWQNDDTPHKAGESVLAFHNPTKYRYFMHFNTMAFITSLSTILLLISGMPSKYRIFMWTLTVIMWTSITAIAVSYTASVLVVTPRRQRPSPRHLVTVGGFYWVIVIVIVFILNSGRLWKRWTRRR